MLTVQIRNTFLCYRNLGIALSKFLSLYSSIMSGDLVDKHAYSAHAYLLVIH